MIDGKKVIWCFLDLKHIAATLMFKQGIHPKVVQERLGHSDISLTLNTYSHATPAMQQEAAAKMDELLKPIKYKDVVVSPGGRTTIYIYTLNTGKKPLILGIMSTP